MKNPTTYIPTIFARYPSNLNLGRLLDKFQKKYNIEDTNDPKEFLLRDGHPGFASNVEYEEKLKNSILPFQIKRFFLLRHMIIVRYKYEDSDICIPEILHNEMATIWADYLKQILLFGQPVFKK